MLKFIKSYLTFNVAFFLGVMFGTVISSVTIYAMFSNSMNPERIEELLQIQNCLIEEVKLDK